MKELKLKLKVATQHYQKDGEDLSFLTYKVLTKKGWKDCKFRKEVEAPTTSCYIIVNEDAVSFDFQREYPCVWIAEILRTEELKHISVEDYFD